MLIVHRVNVGRHESLDEWIILDSFVVVVFFQKLAEVRQVDIADVRGVVMKIAVPLDYPLVFCHNLSGQLGCAETIIGKRITCINYERRDFHIRSVPEGFCIADTPCQSTHRVARSATGFQAAVNIGTVHDRQRVAVVFA